MKNKSIIPFVIIALMCAFGFSTQASLIFTEEYPTTYGEATALGSNQTTGGYNTKWPTGNSTGAGAAISTSAAALTYGPLQQISGATSLGLRATTASSRDTAAAFATQSGDGNSVYCSFLINVTAATPTARILMGLRNSTGSGTLAASVSLTAGRQLTLNKSGTAAGTDPTILNIGQTYLVVFRYKFVTGSGTDQVAMWVNPTTGSADETFAGVTPVTGATGSDQNTLLSLRLPSATDASGPLYLDEIRIGSAWTDVTPLGGPIIGEKLGFTTQPANAAPSATLSPVVVQVQNTGGSSASSNGVPVTLALTAGSGTLSGTLTQNTDASGKATFSNLSINIAGTGKQLTATASGIGAGLTAATSATFSIVEPSVGSQLVFTTQPGNALTNAPINSIVVQIRDASSVNVPSNGVPITLTLTTGAGTLNGTTTQNTDGTGKATFAGLSIDTAGAGDQLTASASGIGAGLAAALSATFSITNAPGGGGSGGDLYITSASSVPTGLRVQGTNNTGGIFTQILGASSPDAPATNWLIVNYKTGDGSGVVTFTNPVSPALPNAFYRLRTGNNVTKLEPPSIGVQPANQIVSPGATATFTVTATGPQLQYLWFFNGNPIPGATSSSLIIPNAQAGNVGNYYVAIANPAGNVNSVIATLGVGNIGPTITSNPANQTNNAGGTAIFNVAATGTSPLSYQWYFNNTTPLAGKTSPQLLLSGIATNDAGNYRCTVTNAFGSATSANASLTVNPVPTGLPDTNIVGFAAAAGVTGGAGGAESNVTTYAALRAACRAAGPLIIRLDGALVPNEAYCYIEGFDKTIVGVGTNSGLYGAGFRVSGTNIIIANIIVSATNANSDGVTIDDSSHGTGRNVWVDHCTFYNCTDGSVDVTKGADYVTVSWCKFYYAPVPPGTVTHQFVNLIASSDTDNPGGAQYHVTFHHNWYSDYCRERMPSVRFGRVHVFNNYYDCVDNNYCVRTRLDAEVLVENNYFLGVQNPWERFVTGTPGNFPGRLKASGNITNNCTFVNGWVSGAIVIPGNDTLLDATLTTGIYPYTLTPASDVPYYIQTYSGNGKYPYVP